MSLRFGFLVLIVAFSAAVKAQDLKTTHEYNVGKPFESLFWVDGDAQYASAYKMREQKKVGLGVAFGGALGLAGLNLELNFEDSNSALGGFGVGPGYNSFFLAWKHIEDTRDLSLYYELGYSRWYSNSNSNGNPKNSSTLKAVFDNKDFKNPLSADFLVGTLGTQFYQLNGTIAGMSFYGELNLMYELGKQRLVPSGGIGSTYYF